MTKPPITAAEVPPEWTAIVRKIIADEKREVRGPAGRAVIEVRSLRDNSWHPLMLFSSASHFVTVEDRDAVLKQILG